MTFKIVIISSGQPSLNPRLVKEADALASQGYDVTVLYAYWNDWGTHYDQQLLAGKKWKAIRVGGDPQEKRVTWFVSRLMHKTAAYILQKTGNYRHLADFAIARSSYFLIRAAKKHKADLYIAHNLGALPAVVKVALHYKKPIGFDAEDFHRQEVTDDVNSFHYKICSHIEDKYLPSVNYVTASSPLIAERYTSLYNTSVSTILNVFPAANRLVAPVINNNVPLKLFWFSQTIGPNRGIEAVIQAFKLLDKANFELHLLGNITPEDKEEFIEQQQIEGLHIYFHDPVSPEKVVGFAAQFDIGLAAENSIPLNRDICLTNKIFTYMQAGLAIVASDTAAQEKLLGEYPAIGKIYQQGNPQSLADILDCYRRDRNAILGARQNSLNAGQAVFNWEIESGKFLNIIENVLTAPCE
ncbi:MAG: glycosyltransferase [Sphingobacteriales bacterium]